MANNAPQSIYYSDLSYQPGLTQLGDITVVTNLADIQQSIQTIVYTNPGSRLFEPTFGVGIEKYLFEPFSQASGLLIGQAIKTGLIKYEPRISVSSVNVALNESDLSYNITVQYLVIDNQTNDSINIQLTRS